MEVKEFIKFYDNVIPLSAIATLVKWANTLNFKDAEIIMTADNDHGINKKIRNTKHVILNNRSESLTNVHYSMLIAKACLDYIKKYTRDLHLPFFHMQGINDIQLLKYEVGGFYTYHIDHAGIKTPRTMSCILFLNDDYKGGELMFKDPRGQNEITIKPKASRLIIWPSNFMFPHTVKPVTEGVRYSVVAWGV